MRLFWCHMHDICNCLPVTSAQLCQPGLQKAAPSPDTCTPDRLEEFGQQPYNRTLAKACSLTALEQSVHNWGGGHCCMSQLCHMSPRILLHVLICRHVEPPKSTVLLFSYVSPDLIYLIANAAASNSPVLQKHWAGAHKR